MLDETSRTILAWASDVSGVEHTTLSLPDSSLSTPQVSVLLTDFSDHPPMRGNGRSPLQFIARYHVLVAAPDPEDAHRILGELIFAALENPTFDVDLHPIDSGHWQAVGAAPLPSFMLRIPVRRPRPESKAPYVRKPITIQMEPQSVLEGTVSSPDNAPVPSARVELLATGDSGAAASTFTDVAGRFRMTVGPISQDSRVRVSARNFSVTARIDDAIDSDGIVRLRFDPAVR